MRSLPAILIYLSFAVAELHHLAGSELVRVSLYNSEPMPFNWAVKYTTDQLIWLMISIAMLKMNRRRENVAAAKVLIWWMIFDTISYFYNYKTFLYGQTYALLGLLIVVFNINGRKLFGILHEKGNQSRATPDSGDRTGSNNTYGVDSTAGRYRKDKDR